MSEKKSGYSPAMEAFYGKKKDSEILKNLMDKTKPKEKIRGIEDI